MKTTIATMLALLLLALPVLGQEIGGEEEEFDVEAAMRKVAELLEQTEGLLVESLKPKDGSTDGAAEAGQEAQKALEELLKQSRESGAAAADKMMEILQKAPRNQGSGQGQESQEPKPQDDEARKERERELGKRDPQNSEKDGQPKDPRESEEQAKDDTTKPPSEAGDASKPDPDDWLAKLPPQVRQKYKNKDWGKIPPKWRAWIEAYVKRLAEKESSGSND